jgi:hypothetical protein
MPTSRVVAPSACKRVEMTFMGEEEALVAWKARELGGLCFGRLYDWFGLFKLGLFKSDGSTLIPSRMEGTIAGLSEYVQYGGKGKTENGKMNYHTISVKLKSPWFAQSMPSRKFRVVPRL